VVPFFLIQVVILMLFVIFPDIVTWLPEQAANRLR